MDHSPLVSTPDVVMTSQGHCIPMKADRPRPGTVLHSTSVFRMLFSHCPLVTKAGALPAA
jgi:hypothetical protein